MEEREGSRTGQKKKSTYDGGSKTALNKCTEKSTALMNTKVVQSGLKWLCLFIYQLLRCALSWEEHDLGKGSSLQLRQSLERLRVEVCLSTALRQVRAKRSSFHEGRSGWCSPHLIFFKSLKGHLLIAI